MAEDKLKIALVGISAELKTLLAPICAACQIVEIPYDMDKLLEPFPFKPVLIFCGLPPTEIPTTEVAQALRMHYQKESIYYVTEARETFNHKLLKKNGFSEAFLIPADNASLAQTVERELAMISDAVKAYRQVQLVDVAPGSTLGFDLYLNFPANNKKIRYVSSTDKIDEKQLKKLEEHKVGSAMVSQDQMAEFYKFTANQLRKLGKEGTLTETERKERREKAVRNLLSNVFGSAEGEDSIGNGRNIMTDCQEIVKSYVNESQTAQGSWYERLSKLAQNASNSYSHASNLSTLAALFAIGLGQGNVEEVALAGLLCDIGLVDVPLSISMKPKSQWSKEELAVYQKHPLQSIELIKARKMIVTDKVLKIIEQHHERFNGSGYPEKMVGPRICIEAQILGLADEVDSQMVIEQGKLNRPPSEIVSILLKEALKNPINALFDPALLKKIVALFTEPNGKSAEVA